MKIVAISDTHTSHAKFVIPECDVLIHSGDFSWTGEASEVSDFLAWFEQQPATHKLVIAGNHELAFDERQSRFDLAAKNILARRYEHNNSVIYLEDEAYVVDGVKFYGTPWTTAFCGWAFNGYSDAEAPHHRGAVVLSDVYSKIPEDTNVIICHGPPYDLVDRSSDGRRCGSVEMRNIMEELPLLRLYLCGHIHEARGSQVACGNVNVCNVSSLGLDYEPAGPPVIIDLDENGFIDSIQGYE
jgi:Icc-related predicted phosphoesterase